MARTRPARTRRPGPPGHGPGDPPPGSTPGQEETVTIDDGDRSISVTSPDGQGQVKVTVDDGSGQPKTYTLDFGEGTTPGASGTTAGAAPRAAPTAVPGGTQAAASGAATAARRRASDQPIQPGEDGKCVIQDGDLTITAERPDGLDRHRDGHRRRRHRRADHLQPGLLRRRPAGHPGQATSRDTRAGSSSEAQAMYRQLDDQLDGVISDLDGQQAPEPVARPRGPAPSRHRSDQA